MLPLRATLHEVCITLIDPIYEEGRVEPLCFGKYSAATKSSIPCKVLFLHNVYKNPCSWCRRIEISQLCLHPLYIVFSNNKKVMICFPEDYILKFLFTK